MNQVGNGADGAVNSSEGVLKAEDWQVWRNLSDMWVSQVQTYGDRVVAVAKRDGRWRNLNWNEVDREARKLALGLMSLGMHVGDSVAIFSKTRLDWIEACLGILLAGGRLVCIYHTDSPPQCEHIITNSDTKICFAEEQEQLGERLVGHRGARRGAQVTGRLSRATRRPGSP